MADGASLPNLRGKLLGPRAMGDFACGSAARFENRIGDVIFRWIEVSGGGMSEQSVLSCAIIRVDVPG
jgi:hypothetical protein